MPRLDAMSVRVIVAAIAASSVLPCGFRGGGPTMRPGWSPSAGCFVVIRRRLRGGRSSGSGGAPAGGGAVPGGRGAAAARRPRRGRYPCAGAAIMTGLAAHALIGVDVAARSHRGVGVRSRLRGAGDPDRPRRVRGLDLAVVAVIAVALVAVVLHPRAGRWPRHPRFRQRSSA